MVRSKIKGKDIIEVLSNPSKSIIVDLPQEVISQIEQTAVDRVVDGATEQFNTLKEIEVAINNINTTVSNKEDKVTVKTSLDDVLTDNTIYDLTGSTTTSISIQSVPVTSNTIMIYFTTGTGQTSISIPVTKWVNNEEPSPTEANTTYVIGILNGIGTFATIENS